MSPGATPAMQVNEAPAGAPFGTASASPGATLAAAPAAAQGGATAAGLGASASTAADTAALHAELKMRFSAVYNLAELPLDVQQKADCWSLGRL